MFVAAGEGTNTLAYSYDGINWSASTSGNNAFSGGKSICIGWNGLYWLAGGYGANYISISTDGINWSGLNGSSTFTGMCSAILWTGSTWIAGGTSSSNTGIIAYSINNGSSWTTVSCPITQAVTGFASNQQTIVAIGYTSSLGTGNTLAYSTDIYGTSWTGIGTTVFNDASGAWMPTVKWSNNKFVAFSYDSGNNRIAYSFNGSKWNISSNVQTIMTTAALGGACSTTLPHNITFPSNAMISGNLISRDSGLSWTPTSSNLPANAVGFNGSQYIFAGINGATSYLTYDLCGNYIQLPIGTDPSGINVIKWNGTQWLMGGNSQTNRQVLMSYDGLSWSSIPISAYTQSNYPCNGISWNGSLWVVSGVTSSNTFLLYSSNGVNWALSSNTLGGGPVEWNGSYFICGGPSSGTISKSSDGVNWTSQSIGAYGNIQGFAWNGNVWILTTDSTSTVCILMSYDGSTWSEVGGIRGYACKGVVWNGLSFVINTNTTAILYSYDGINWTSVSIGAQNGNNLLWTNPNVGKMNIQQPTIVGGSGTYHSMVYSIDGIFYKGLGNGIFGTACYDVTWNGDIWVAGGQGTNTLAYSYDGLKWTGLGSSVFTGACYSVGWNNTVWVACGAGGNTIATSSDGKTWTGLGTAIFDVSGTYAHWNGSVWLAVGNGSTHTLAVSTNSNASTWTGLGKTILTTSGSQVIWMINKWIAVGQGTNTIMYTTDISGSTGWTAASNVFSSSCNAVYWNGRTAVAGGAGGNTLATSSDGITWTGIGTSVFSTACNGIYWNTQRWVAVGSGTNTVAYSYDGTTWYSALNTNSLLSAGYGVGSNSKIGSIIVNSGLYLTTNDRLVVNTPSCYDDSLSSDTAISMNMNLPI